MTWHRVRRVEQEFLYLCLAKCKLSPEHRLLARLVAEGIVVRKQVIALKPAQACTHYEFLQGLAWRSLVVRQQFDDDHAR
jgi:hypothetical protein